MSNFPATIPDFPLFGSIGTELWVPFFHSGRASIAVFLRNEAQVYHLPLHPEIQGHIRLRQFVSYPLNSTSLTFLILPYLECPFPSLSQFSFDLRLFYLLLPLPSVIYSLSPYFSTTYLLSIPSSHPTLGASSGYFMICVPLLWPLDLSSSDLAFTFSVVAQHPV